MYIEELNYKQISMYRTVAEKMRVKLKQITNVITRIRSNT